MHAYLHSDRLDVDVPDIAVLVKDDVIPKPRSHQRAEKGTYVDSWLVQRTEVSQT